VSGLGVYLSVVLDLPTGATIVCTFGGVLALMFLLHFFLHCRRAVSTTPLDTSGTNMTPPPSGR
jgi:hypothetical protein